jgi:hypothetical protein
MIIGQSYFDVLKSDFVSLNLIWAQIKFWSNSRYITFGILYCTMRGEVEAAADHRMHQQPAAQGPGGQGGLNAPCTLYVERT